MANEGVRWADIWEAVKSGNSSDHKPRHYGNGVMPDIPSDQEREDWINSIPENGRPSDIREYLHKRSPHRWRRIQSDLRWMEKELSKLGMNPEDARWYL